jgi:lipopolysaccharide export system protein LptA
MNTIRLTSTIAVALSVILVAAPAAAEIEVDGDTSDLIGNVADVVGAFKLSKLPATLHVQADRMEFDYKAGRLAYEGHVDVTHGEIRVKSKQLVMTFEPEDAQELKTIRATGDVEVIRGDEVARGQTAVYDRSKATLRLTGNATLGSGPNLVEGESVVVFLDEGRAIVEGGRGPVRAILEPDSLDDEELLN